MARPSRRDELLEAALAVIRRDGAHALTLDAVAAEAGVSKGGVLYHFASKRALVDGVLERWLDDFGARLGEGASVTRSYVHASDLQTEPPGVVASEFGVLAALLEEPGALRTARERHEEWMEDMLAEGRDRADTWIVRLAADGLWYADLLGLAPPGGEDRRRVLERLMALAGSAPR